jgi:hypothetical protein
LLPLLECSWEKEAGGEGAGTLHARLRHPEEIGDLLHGPRQNSTRRTTTPLLGGGAFWLLCWRRACHQKSE